MQALWRKTVQMLWQKPVLWLTLIVADLAAYFITWFQKSATQAIVHWTQTSRSILGGDVPRPAFDNASILKGVLLTVPLALATQFLHVCIYVAAFVVTATLIGKIHAGEKPDWPWLPSLLRAHSSEIAQFSAKLFLLYFVGSVLFIALPMDLIRMVFNNNSFDAIAFGTVASLLISVAIAWLLTPVGIQLIQSPEAEELTAEGIKLGRISAILAVLVSGILSFSVMKANASLNAVPAMTPWFVRGLMGVTFSIAVAAPYLWLWVALSEIAREQTHAPAAGSETSSLVVE
jgi:hypothetical protein